MKTKKLKLRGRVSSLVLSVVLVLMAPLSIFFVFSVLLFSFLTKSNNLPVTVNKRVLLTGGKMTKSLQLARLFCRAGYQVHLAETEKYSCSGHAYSNCVTSFHLYPIRRRASMNTEKKLRKS